MKDVYKQLAFAREKLEQRIPEPPEFAFVLGTGLSGLKDKLERPIRIPYAEIPGIPAPTAPAHESAFFFGYFGEKPVLMMGGRFHFYEGYSMQEVTFAVRLMCLYPLKFLWISNAAGGVNEAYESGDVVFVRDHINMMPETPLRGANDERLGPRFPDMLKTYRADWNRKAMAIAAEEHLGAHEGVYFGWQGPALETPAEYEMIHRLGGDVVGMSTIPEVLVAKHMDTPVMVSSVVSNVCYPLERIRETSVEDVIAVVQQTTPKLEKVAHRFVNEFEGDE